jgi:hypothetical protein
MTEKPRCYVCRKTLKGEPSWAHLRTDLYLFASDQDPIVTGAPDDQGWFEVGPDCYRRIRAAGLDGLDVGSLPR